MIYAKELIVLVSVLGYCLAKNCPCDLKPSTKYSSSYLWDCMTLGLVSVPGQCWGVQSKNVTEVYLSDNVITSVRNIDFADLFDLKELYLDTNEIQYFDPTALLGVPELEIFNVGHNLNMRLPVSSLMYEKELVEIDFVGSKILTLPNIQGSTKLQILDARSCDLSTLPRPLFGNISSDQFLLNLIGNQIVDVAADILLPVPDGAIINVDSYFTIWAKDEEEKQEILQKQWEINIDLDINLKVCNVDGIPTDTTMC